MRVKINILRSDKQIIANKNSFYELVVSTRVNNLTNPRDFDANLNC